MDDCLLVKVQHFVDRIGVATLIEVVADPQMLEVPVPVELVVIVESNRCELGFVLRQEHRNTIPSEVGTSHRDDMGCGFRHHVTQQGAKTR